MKLREIGEFGFIERFSPEFKSLLTQDITGIGDDCAVLPMNESEDLLVTTDMLVEEIHFLRDGITPRQLGYKSVAVNLSDIAAMGGEPLGTFLSIAIPPEIDVEYLDELMKGYHEISVKYKVPLLGGDTTRSVKHLAINVSVLGKCPKGMARLRSMAEAGDVICTTGYLGDSGGGLKLLLEKVALTADSDNLLKRHHLPEPHLPEGRFLQGFPGVHAMIDVSDGIASDLKHILKASGKAAHIHLDHLPVSDSLRKVCEEQRWNVEELATGGGEDYELIFTVERGQLEKLQEEFFRKFNHPVYPVGTIEDREPAVQWFRNGQAVTFANGGFNHFLSSNVSENME